MLNRSFRKSFGLADKEWTSYALSEIIDNKELLAILGREEDDIGRGELDAADGKNYSVQISLVESVGTVASLQDISYLKELDRLKGDFVNTVSHDLRSPLTAILGYVELIDRAGDVNEQQADFIQRVKDSVGSTTNLINYLLNLGRIEGGSVDDIEQIAFTEIVEDRMDAYRTRADDKKIAFLFQADKELSNVMGNPTQLRQVADNLIGNAIKYTL
jgi:signal transduction histidine kinase